MKRDPLPAGTLFIEIRGVYDGWSVAELPDGTLLNRWEESDGRRYQETEDFIKQYRAMKEKLP